MSRLTVRLALLLAVIATAAAVPASAQDLSSSPPMRPDRAYRITPRWDTYVFSTGTSSATTESRTNAWANVFSTQVDLGAVVLRLAVPLAFADFSSRITILGVTTSSHSSQAELGNIELEALADIDLGSPDHRLLIGGGMALPTATDPLQSDGTDFRGAAIRIFNWATSFRNAAAWSDNSFTIWPTVEYRLATPWILFTASVALPLFLPTQSRVGGPLHRGNAELMFTSDITGAVRLLESVDIGASFLAWALPSGAGYHDASGAQPDLGQTALTLFVRTDEAIDSPVGGGFEMIFDLDNSWGPTGDDGRFWGAHIFVTGQIDG
jgi:hypothetical protein